jgi:hemoglobin-like flavoprotein
MTKEEIHLVRLTWGQLRTRRDEFASLCYDALFARDPEIRAMFQGFMNEQHRNLSEMLTRIMNELEDQPNVRREMKALGARHDVYGVKPHHYLALSEAMMSTLERMLGNDFTPKVRQSWLAFYLFMQKGMTA